MAINSFLDSKNEIHTGLQGENVIREQLMKRYCRFMQIDIMFEKEKKWYVCEVKHQERFKAPPFDGHGLPPWQLNARIEFSKQFNMIPLFIVLDKEDNKIYYQNMNKLIKGKSYLTKTGKRIVFPLTSFKIMERI